MGGDRGQDGRPIGEVGAQEAAVHAHRCQEAAVHAHRCQEAAVHAHRVRAADPGHELRIEIHAPVRGVLGAAEHQAARSAETATTQRPAMSASLKPATRSSASTTARSQ